MKHGSQERKAISKLIQREITTLKRAERRSKIQQIVEEFRGLKRISGVKSRKKQKYIYSMADSNGQEQTKRQTIANISVC